MTDSSIDSAYTIRRVCIGLITRRKFLHAIQPFAADLNRLLEGSLGEPIAAWCLDFFRKYEQRAPGSQIEPYFKDHRHELDPVIAEQIEIMLRSLSEEHADNYDEWKTLNTEHLLDQTREWMRQRHGELHDDEVARLRDRGDHEAAEELRKSYKPLSFGDDQSELVWANDVQAQPVKWLWKPRFPLGETTFLLGDPDQGKSTLALDIAARTSRGAEWPIRGEGHAPKGGALILTAEDRWEHTIKPRLIAAGAAMKRIAFLPAVVTRTDPRTRERSYRHWSVQDIARIQRALADFERRGMRCLLFVIDPLAAFMGGKDFDAHKTTDVRTALLPLEERIIREHEIALLAIHHPNKSQQRAIYRTSGSVAFSAGPRAGFAVGTIDDDPDRHVMARIKANLTDDRSGMAYRIASVPVTFENGESADLPVIHWDPAPVDVTADDLLSGGKDVKQVEVAKRWLQEKFDDGRSRDAAEVRKEAEADGIKYSTLNNARLALRIRTEGRGRGGTKWTPPPKPDFGSYLRTPRTMPEIARWTKEHLVGITVAEAKRFVRELAKNGAAVVDQSGPQTLYSMPAPQERGASAEAVPSNVVAMLRPQEVNQNSLKV